jgi:enoyl-CoA hydratase/carnithine racemase
MHGCDGRTAVAADAFDLPMIEELRLTFERLEKLPLQVGVVLTGTGQTFSAGVDRKAYAAYEPMQRRALLHAGTALTAAIFALSCPLVAAVNGHALAGGCMLMLCCDDDTLSSSGAAGLRRLTAF